MLSDCVWTLFTFRKLDDSEWESKYEQQIKQGEGGVGGVNKDRGLIKIKRVWLWVYSRLLT